MFHNFPDEVSKILDLSLEMFHNFPDKVSNFPAYKLTFQKFLDNLSKFPG